MFSPEESWHKVSRSTKGFAMGQFLHGSATTTEAVRRPIKNGQASLTEAAVRYGINSLDRLAHIGRSAAALCIVSVTDKLDFPGQGTS